MMFRPSLTRAADNFLPYDGLPSPSKDATDKDVCRTTGTSSSVNRRTRWLTIYCCTIGLLVTLNHFTLNQWGEWFLVVAAEPGRVETDLLEREPFDQITLDAANDNAVLEVMPLEDPPADPQPGDRLRVQLLDRPDQLFQIEGRHIAKFRTYEQLLFDEAQRLVQAKQFNEAFRYYQFLLENSQSTPGLQQAVLEYYLANAAELVAREEYERALLVLEELIDRDASYRATEVDQMLTTVVDRLMQQLADREAYVQLRGLIARMEARFGADRIRSLPSWQSKLRDQAEIVKQAAEESLQAEDYREAERLARESMHIWPDLAGLAELSQQISDRYPIVMVGVLETAGQPDRLSMDGWSARRTGWLTQRALVEFAGVGPEGGEYRCEFGEYYESDNRRRLTLELDPVKVGKAGLQINGYDVAQQLLAVAEPTGHRRLRFWRRLMENVSIEKVFHVQVDLRRPHVLAEGMWQIPLHLLHASAPDDPRYAGAYVAAGSDDGSSDDGNRHFVANRHGEQTASQQVAEIVERSFDRSRDAVAALERGEIDMVDFLTPDDANRLRQNPSVTVRAYDLPTIHLLVPCSNNRFLANATFRRAIVYALDRQTILEEEMLGNSRLPGCRVISGPFPAGRDISDPLSYAYDESIEPRAFYPRLAIILKTLARREMVELAAKREETIPSRTRLVIGFPGNELARVTCHAIAQQLQVLGIEIELREFDKGVQEAGEAGIDLLYQQLAMWEPVTDIHQLLASEHGTTANNEYVEMALRRLSAAQNWREARARLFQLHRIVHDQVAVVPLWQTVDHFAFGPRLRDVAPRPLTLYQNVEQWSVQ